MKNQQIVIRFLKMCVDGWLGVMLLNVTILHVVKRKN